MRASASRETYKRNQVEEALWSLFAMRHGGGKAPPSAFSTRIKRLLEIDRTIPPPRGGHYAFTDEPASGKGFDSSFSELRCACLAIGLEMLDIGFKQREIVAFLRNFHETIRSSLDFVFAVGKGYPSGRRQKSSSLRQENGLYDYRLFMIVRKIELTEALPDSTGASSRGADALRRPVFCSGLEELAKHLDRMPRADQTFRSCIVLEIGTMIETLLVHLVNSIAKKRGRT